MRPVNLIPAEEQRSSAGRGPMRTGGAAYVVLGALALGLIGVIAMAVTSKQISDQEQRVQSLEQDLAAQTTRAQSLRAFADFRAVQEARTATVSSLAQSRFDWERVLRELSLIIPSDVWLLKMTGSVNPAVQIEGGADVQIRSTIPGPALEIVGCAPSQDAVAGFVAALEDIDGVTRVGLGASERPDAENGAEVSSASADGQSEDCRTRRTIYQFEIAVAFDAVPAPPTATSAPSVPAPVAPPTSPAGQLANTPPTTDSDSAAAQSAEAQQATGLIPGG